MKNVMMMVMTLTLAALCGCHTGPRGGTMGVDEGFKISAPNFTTDVKQGELQTVVVSLQRDAHFKQDVKLQVSIPKGINIEPSSLTIKASDKPDIQLQIAAPKDAALGEYPVVVKGTPETGAQSFVGFTVRVVAP